MCVDSRHARVLKHPVESLIPGLTANYAYICETHKSRQHFSTGERNREK